MPSQTYPGAELIAGYQLVQRLGTGGFGEVWKTTAPGGLTKALKIVYGHLNEARADQELKALERIKAVRHPFLLSLERVEVIDNQLLIVTELADRSLLDRFLEACKSGLAGIPREELLGYMRDAADALDYLNESFGLQHLDIKPQNLLLVGGRIKIGDFGLVKDLRGGSATATGGVTPLYATPEAFDGRVSRYSDQYSLSIVYQEMLTGVRPFPGTTTLQLALQHGNSEPLLHPLPVHDRPVIGRALAKIPNNRFPSCRDMVNHLVRAGSAPREAAAPAEAVVRTPVRAETPPGAQTDTPTRVGKQRKDLPATKVNESLLHGRERVDETPSASRLVSMPFSPPASDAGLRPTLIVGIGGLAGWTLRGLRQKLHQRFGDLTTVPAVRLLLLDIDRAALQEARQGNPGEVLEVAETMHLPLYRPEHYRDRAQELLKWLDRRLLYNIPRSQLTEGLRPLGRLALLDNLTEVQGRLREQLRSITSAEAGQTTAATTGAALRNQTPQVFLVSSIAGGTAGGMLLDFAYLLRQVLAELGHDNADLTGVLVHATGQRPAEAELARVNAYATLCELQHYSRPSSLYSGDPGGGLEPCGPGIAPFEHCYLVHLGDQLEPASAEEATNALAEYLFVNAATPVGAFVDCWRRGSIQGVHSNEFPSLRLSGVYRYSSPQQRLATLASRLLCSHVVSGWLGERSQWKGAQADSDLQAQLTSWGVESRALINELNEVAFKFLGSEPEKYLLQTVAGLSPDQQELTPAALKEALDKVDTFFTPGVTTDPADGQRGGSLELALRKHAKDQSGRAARAAVMWLITLVQDPARRIAAAATAAASIRKYLSDLLGSLTQQVDQLIAYLGTARARLPAEAASDKGPAAGWLGGLRRQAPTSSPYQRLTEYCLFRIKELVLRKAAQVPEGMQVPLATWAGRLADVDHKVRQFRDSFKIPAPGSTRQNVFSLYPGQTDFLPQDSQSLTSAAAQLFRRSLPTLEPSFEARLEAECLQSLGGLWGAMTATDDRLPWLRESLVKEAHAAMQAPARELDAAAILFECKVDAETVKLELAQRIASIAPSMDVPRQLRHFVLAVPTSQAGAKIREALSGVTGEIATAILDSDGDLIFCHETAGLAVGEMLSILIGDKSRYVEAAGQVASRNDVAWIGAHSS